MLFAYLDEFGHIGPFVHRQDPAHKHSPVFGMAGIILPERSIRPFASAFLQLKARMFEADIAKAERHAHNWEKKGSEIFRPKAIDRYPSLRELGFRLLNTIRKHEGRVFYHGREKIIGATDVNPTGLYTTIFSKTIRQLDAYANSVNSNFALVVDEHAARVELLECAAKTMYGHRPTKRLVSPPFEVESYLNQNIQAADWVATIVGRMAAYRTLPDQFRDHANIEKYFADRVATLATHSTIIQRQQRPVLVPITEPKRPTLRYSVADQK